MSCGSSADSLRFLYADKGLSFIITAIIWPEIVETTLLALEAGSRLQRTEDPKCASEEMTHERPTTAQAIERRGRETIRSGNPSLSV